MPVGPVFGIAVIVVKDKSSIVESYLDRVTRGSQVSSIEAFDVEFSKTTSLIALSSEHLDSCRFN